MSIPTALSSAVSGVSGVSAVSGRGGGVGAVCWGGCGVSAVGWGNGSGITRGTSATVQNSGDTNNGEDRLHHLRNTC